MSSRFHFFNPELDYDEIASWTKAYKRPFVRRDMLPPTGFIVPGVLAGFLIKTDAQFGIIEHYVGNPNVTKLERKRALKVVSDALISYGYMMGMKYFMCITAHPSIRELCDTYKFDRLEGAEVFLRKEDYK